MSPDSLSWRSVAWFDLRQSSKTEITTAESLIKTDSPSDVITSTTGTFPYPGTASLTCAFTRFYTKGDKIKRFFPMVVASMLGHAWFGRIDHRNFYRGRTDLGDWIYFNIFKFKTVIIKECSYFSTKWTSIITIDFQFKSINRRASALLWTDINFWYFLLNNCTFCFFTLKYFIAFTL